MKTVGFFLLVLGMMILPARFVSALPGSSPIRSNSNWINNLVVNGDDIWCATWNGINKWNRRTGVLTSYNEEQGLANFYVRSVGVDSRGTVWCGSPYGISRFDGRSWEALKTVIPNTDVLATAEDRDGILWFGTFGGGVASFDGSVWKVYTTADGLAHNSVYTVAVDRNNVKWFGTGGGITRFDGASWKSFTTADGLVHNDVRAIAIDENDTVWCATTDGSFMHAGLSRFDGTVWKSYSTFDGLLASGAVSLAIDREGVIWIGALQGLTRFDGTAFQKFTSIGIFENEYVYSIGVDGDNVKWFGTSKGMVRYDGVTWTPYIVSGLANGDVRSIAVDRDNVKWFGTYKGISSFDGKTWNTYTKADGLPDDEIWTVAVDKENVKWFATNYGGAISFDGNAWISYPSAGNTRTVAVDRDDVKWFGSDKGVVRYDGREWTTVTIDGMTAQPRMTAITVDGKNVKWMSDGYRLFRFDGQVWTIYAKETGGFPGDQCLSLSVDDTGLVWVGYVNNNDISDCGTAVFDGSAWKRHTPADGLIDRHVHAVVVDRNGVRWFGTSRGLSRFDGVRWTSYTHRDVLPNSVINTLAVDRDNTLWVGTGYGVAVFENGAWKTVEGHIVTGITENPPASPFAIQGNYPNPFNPSTTINYTLSVPGKMDLSIYSIAGQKVRTLVSGSMATGSHSAVWDGRDDSGATLSSGVYLYRLQCGPFAASGRMTLVK